MVQAGIYLTLRFQNRPWGKPTRILSSFFLQFIFHLVHGGAQWCMVVVTFRRADVTQTTAMSGADPEGGFGGFEPPPWSSKSFTSTVKLPSPNVSHSGGALWECPLRRPWTPPFKKSWIRACMLAALQIYLADYFSHVSCTADIPFPKILWTLDSFLLKGIYPEFQVIRGFSQKILADLLSYDQIHS